MKRANGTGSIVKLSGNRRRPYAVKVSERDKYGQVVQKILSYHAKASEAQQALDAYNIAKSAGAAPAVSALDITVGEIYKLWSEREFPRLNDPSVRAHRGAWVNRVSALKDKKIRFVSLDEMQHILDRCEDDGMSRSTINNTAILIKALWNYAAKRDMIAKDYSQYLEIPIVGIKNPRNIITPQQIKQLRGLADAGVFLADTAVVLCYTGFRISEFLELTPADYHPEHGGYLQGGLKTAAGKNRIVPVHKSIAPYVVRWLQRGTGSMAHKENGQVMNADYYRREFNELLRGAGIDGVTPHWCRHTFATMLHAAKVDPTTTKWLLGHSTSSDITAHYTHETLDILRGAIDQLPTY